MFKVVLIVAVFGVVVSSFPHSGKGLKYDGEHVSRIRQVEQNYGIQDGHRRQFEQDSQSGHGWSGEQRGHGVSEELEGKGGHGSHVGPEGDEGQVVQRGEGRNDGRGVYGEQNGQSGNRNYLSSLESSSSESFEIKKAQKQFHDTDPEFAGNGRMVPNQMRPRHHKAIHLDTQDLHGETFNRIYKDI